MVRKNKRKKEEIAEDWCFVCKDGGLLMVCDHRDCLKSYHPCCVGKDDSFVENGSRWTCDSHICFLCHKVSKFKCYCCPSAVCGSCIYVAEFATVKGNRGFCCHCSKLALLIEENADVDSDGGMVDFKDRDTYECLFSEYYEIIKEKEGLNSQHVHSSLNSLKNRNNKCDMDLDEIGEEDIGESEDVSNFIVSDSDDLNDTAGSKSVRKKKGERKLKSMRGNVKDKKKEFIGWGSRSLIKFLQNIGKDTSKEFSEHDVTSIIIEYCRDKKLFDPVKKRKVLCDAQLRSLLGRKSVNRNNIQNLLARHFAENFEEMDYIPSSSEDMDDNEPFQFLCQEKIISSAKSRQNVVSEVRQSCFAAIVSSNLKLVYLKRSLMEELLKQPETFDDKVLGSYVRVKSDPHDYFQKNSHLLVQVVGINRTSKNDEINKEILLHLSNVPKDLPICKISDGEFSEEECQDLYQRMRNGLLKQPTILELEQKARSLHEDRIKHWIPRELALLQNRIDQYMDRKLKLETPLEQSRLLSDIPKVIAEIVETNVSTESSPVKDKIEQNGLSELAIGENCNSVGLYPKHGGSAHCPNNRTYVAVETIVQDVENDGVPTLDSSETRGEILLSNKELRVYTRRNLQQKTIHLIIPKMQQVDSPEISPENVSGQNARVKKSEDGTVFPASIEQFVYTASLDKDTSQRKLLQSTSKARQDDSRATHFEELNLDSQNSNPANCGLHQSRNTKSSSGIVGRNLSATRNAKQTTKEKQSISVADSVKVANDKHDTNISISLEEQEFSISTTDIIVLSDTVEQEANIAEISEGRKVVENPEISIWHCVGPYGEKRGPYSMSALKRWSETVSHPLEFKVWKTGQSEKEAIPLTDALNHIFLST
ncbi:zinc finger CCCH domain-containing protein 19-like [Abrus precatorius]|uniref:Zinc finger CCCH domain-containing protein 19-like n=1 Tax=Abrus precatorius TaxID=3816 RepID=A0A8B8JTG8_ABRPR|nr:zinc finger CCCH domain-containing protein 19-like [Abrus precatorius]